MGRIQNTSGRTTVIEAHAPVSYEPRDKNRKHKDRVVRTFTFCEKAAEQNNLHVEKQKYVRLLASLELESDQFLATTLAHASFIGLRKLSPE
eukprot:6201086-Pleurochrysis_carterae.AAC.2